jgi:hypothetical protein
VRKCLEIISLNMVSCFCPAEMPAVFAGISAGKFAHRAHAGPVDFFASVSPL